MTPVLPDFFLAPSPYDPTATYRKLVPKVVLKAGTKGTAAIAVVRIGASKGGLSFSFSKLPAGITAGISSFEPNDPKEIKVVLFASYAAKPVDTKVTLTATPGSPLVGPAPRSITIPFLVLEEYDLAISGIDVTQGIQLPQSAASALPARNPAKPTAAVPYPADLKLVLTPIGLFQNKLEPFTGAVPLVQGKKTTVHVFAVVVAPAGSSVNGATVLLHGRTKGGSPLPYSPLAAENAPALSLGDPNAVTVASLKVKKGAFRFTLPVSWTTQPEIVLEAELVPPVLYGKAECSLQACLDNNRFELTKVKLYDTGHLDVWPLGFVSFDPKAAPLGSPAKAFALTGKALPLAEGGLQVGGTWRALYDTTNLSEKTMLATVKAFVSDLPVACRDYFFVKRPASCPDLVAGVRGGGIAGLSAGGENVYPPRPGITVVNAGRPLTSVAHETGHALGFQHADTACGGNSGDQDSEPWWPDGKGLLYGITATGRVNGAGNVGSTLGEAKWFDFMSYCAENATDGDSWISLINYRRAFDGLRALRTLRLTSLSLSTLEARATGAVLSVQGYVQDDAVVVTRARPTTGLPVLGPADSPFRIVLRDAAGRVLAEAPMLVEEPDGHGPGTHYVSVDIALPDTSPGSLPQLLYAVEIVSGGRVAARVQRSANTPGVEIVSPQAGARVGGGSSVTLRFRREDADGGALTAFVDYSTDGGTTWKVIAGGIAGEQVVVPSRLLTASGRARLRVRVSDGLNEGSAVTGLFTSLGAPPLVTITAPSRGAAITAAAPLSLEAEAYDDAFRPLDGGALTWFDGERKLATGAAAVASPLAPGSHRLRVVARDRLGRTASDSITLRVRAVVPRLLVVGAPPRIAPGARSLRLRVAATAPAVVTASGPALHGVSARWQVGTRTRTLVVPLRPGPGDVRLVLRATASGLASSLRLTIHRGR